MKLAGNRWLDIWLPEQPGPGPLLLLAAGHRPGLHPHQHPQAEEAGEHGLVMARRANMTGPPALHVFFLIAYQQGGGKSFYAYVLLKKILYI